MSSIDKIQAEITLTDKGFLDAIDRVNARTNTYTKSSTSANKSNEGLAKSFRSVAQGIAVVDGPFGGVASRVSSTASLVSNASAVVLGLGAAFAATGVLMAKSIGAGEQLERQLYKQEAVLKATGYAAGWNAEQLDDMARKTAYATLASVNDIREAQNVMLTFKSVQGGTYREAVELSQDLAVVMGGTAASNAKMLGKALEDPISGISAMSRAGVSFTQAQKDMIKSMVETGDKAEAQRLILAELQKQVGGTGEGEAAGLSGSIDTLGQNFQTLFENVSKSTGAGEGFNIVVKGWSGIIGDAADALEEDSTAEKLEKLAKEELDLIFKIAEAKTDFARNSHIARKAEIKKEMAELFALQSEDAKKTVSNYEKSIETRKRLAEQEAADQLKIKSDAGVKSLAALDSNLASEEEKLTAEYVKQLTMIQTITLSEEEVKSRGYQNLAALRLDYQLKLEDQYNSELAGLNAALVAEQLAKSQAAARDEERRKREEERAEASRQRQLDKADAYFQIVNDGYNQAFLSAESIENLRYQKTEERLAKERQTLIDQNTWTLQQQSDYEKTAENAAAVHEQNLTDIKQSELDARLSAQSDFANIFVGMAESENKTLAAIGQAAAIYNIGISTYEGAMKAYNALAGIPYVGPALGVAAAGAVVAYGAEQAANVKNQTYHTGGIAGQDSDNYGAKLKSGEINATLMTGEEVLTADDPRHRDNLSSSSGEVYSSGVSGGASITNNIVINVDGGQFADEETLAQSVATQVSSQISQWASSSSFKSATVSAVGSYAKQNSGRLPNVRA